MHRYRLTIHITSEEELKPLDIFPREATRDYLEAVLGDMPAQYSVTFERIPEWREGKITRD